MIEACVVLQKLRVSRIRIFTGRLKQPGHKIKFLNKAKKEEALAGTNGRSLRLSLTFLSFFRQGKKDV